MSRDLENKESLLMSYLLGELSQEKRTEVDNWISASAENKKEFDELKSIWELSLSTSSPDFNTDKAWVNIEGQLGQARRNIRPWLALAASLALIITTYYIFLVEQSQVYEITSTEITTKDTLSDGSILTLNEFSSISYSDDFNEDQREVKLEGEAYFEIEKDPQKAFIVQLNNSSVRVLGTAFNIRDYENEENIHVSVNSGLVRFDYLASDSLQSMLSIELKAGEKVIYNKAKRSLIQRSDAEVIQADSYWMNKKLNFEAIRMEKVFDVLEAVYKVDISYENPSIGNCLLTAQFDDASISSIMEVLASTFDLEIESSDKGYIIKGEGCE